MPQAPVARPLAEADLRHQLRPHPARPGRDGLEPLKRRPVLLELAQARPELLERVVVETRADLAGVTEPSPLVVVAHEERTELGPRPLRRGVPADHQLLLGVAFQLKPVARAAAAVRAVGALRDHALEALLAGLAVELLAMLTPAVWVQAQRTAELERASQPS